MGRKAKAEKFGIKIIKTKQEKALLGKQIRTTVRCGIITTIFFEDGSKKEVIGDFE